MTTAIFTENIVLALKVQSEKLGPYIHHVLGQNRKLLLAELELLLPQVESKHRLKLLEILISDGGEDLVPLFVQAINKEPNLLFAKSILLLFGQFENQEALVALRELSRNMRKELLPAHMRVMSKLNAKFREQFYMKEFKDSTQNPKRMKHAAESMLREPHPLYRPFLEEHLRLDEAYRKSAVEVLRELGEETSLEPLFALVKEVIEEIARKRRFSSFLLDKGALELTSLTDYLTALGRLAGWEEDLIQAMVHEVVQKRLTSTMDWVKYSFGPFQDDFWKDISQFLRDFLKGTKPSTGQITRMSLSFDTYVKKRNELLELTAGAIGHIGFRKKVANLFDRVNEAIPHEEPVRPYTMVAFMASYRNHRSADELMRLLETVKDEVLLIRVLDALEEMPPQEITPALVGLATHGEKAIHSRSMDLLGRWHADSETLLGLLKHSDLIIRYECMQIIARYRMEEGYQHLLDYLAHVEDFDQKIQLMKALGAFPRASTGEAIKPMLELDTPAPLRQAAMQTTLRAGGPESMGTLFAMLEKCDARQLLETLGMLFRFLDPLTGDQHPPDLLAYPGKWGTLLMDKSDRFRYQVLNILEKANWEQDLNHSDWMEILQKAAKSIKVKRTEGETRRMQSLFLKAREAMNLQQTRKESGEQEKEKKKNEVVKILDIIEGAPHYERIGALRKLNLVYRTGVLDESDTTRLVYQMQKILKESQGDVSDLKLAISIATKIGNESLNSEIEQLQEHEDTDLARFARSALLLGRKQGTVARTIKKILLLDHSVMGRVLSSFLAKNGFEVIVEHIPGEALATLESHNFDLLLAEYQLGEVTGVDVIREARHRHILPGAVIIMSSSRDEDVHRDIKIANVDAVLIKPFPTTQLYEKIKALEIPVEA